MEFVGLDFLVQSGGAQPRNRRAQRFERIFLPLNDD
jgi:hypothetical protein